MHKKSDKQKKNKRTPWGIAQSKTLIAPGIASYTTASHGGFHLDNAHNREVSDLLKQSTFGGLGLKGWYEEDVDWAIVVFTFPEHFDSARYELALQTLRAHHGDAWLAIQGKDKT